MERMTLKKREAPYLSIYDVWEHAKDVSLQLDSLQGNLSSVGIWLETRTPSHSELIDICKQLLILEGADPIRIRLEYPLMIADKKYIADIVVVDENNKVHTIVECGNLSDPLKIQLFSTLFPRFIWVPFTLIPNIKGIHDFKNQMAEMIEASRKANEMLTGAIGYTNERLVIERASRASLKELLDAMNTDPIEDDCYID